MKRWIVIFVALLVAFGGYFYWQSTQLPPDLESKGEKVGIDSYIAITVSICGALTAIAQALKAFFEARKASIETGNK